MARLTSKVYPENGISIEPHPVKKGEKVVINYEGLLAKNGADQVYLHMGYGSNDRWHDIMDVPMRHNKEGWSCFFVPQYDTINFCFHDSANNWDNNNGCNWSIKAER